MATIQHAMDSPSRPTARSLARAARATALRALFSMRSARRTRLGFEGRRSAHFLARSAFATCRSARLMARSSWALATSARRRRRHARNLEASGQTSQASAPAPATRNAPLLPCSTPYQAPTTTAGRVAACRSHRACITACIPGILAGSVDPVGALELAHERDDLRNILLCEARHRGHVPELPVVAHDAVRDRALEEPVRVVSRLIDLVKEWRSGVGAGRVLAVANGAVFSKEPRTRLRLGRELGDDDVGGGRADEPPCTAPDESDDD